MSVINENHHRSSHFFLFSLLLTNPAQTATLSLHKIVLPEGFRITVFAENVPNARSMALSPGGTLFVGTRTEGKVYAIKDSDRNYKADDVITLASGLNMPNGVVFHDGDLYVAEVNRVLRFPDIEQRLTLREHGGFML